jgi:hypothetical protein
MSGKSRADYASVFNAINNRLHAAVEEALTDNVKAMQSRLRTVFLNVSIKGGAIHWMQACYRNIQTKCLQTAYSNDEGTYEYL